MGLGIARDDRQLQSRAVGPSGLRCSGRGSWVPNDKYSQRCTDAIAYGPHGVIRLWWLPEEKKYQFNANLFDFVADELNDYSSYSNWKLVVFYEGTKMDTFKKSQVGADYIFHGKFDNRYGKKGSKRFVSGGKIRLSLEVDSYSFNAMYGFNSVGGAVGSLYCVV